ncbi:MAG: OmpA family protein [Chitinophagaceae bacterium]|nr:OmpA family protein [Chitinophagaceae bacterium]
MKKLLLLTTLYFCSTSVKSQDYLGLSTGNYSGTQGLLLQPANVSDNRYMFDINLFSTSFNFSNNYLGFSKNYFINNRFKFNDFQNFNDFKTKVLIENKTTDNTVHFNLSNRIQFPLSFLLTTGKKSGIGFNLQSRTAIGFNNLNRDLAKQIFDLWGNSSSYNYNYNTDGLDITGLNWIEAGLTYGKVLMEADKHFLKFGVTGKYLGGISSMYLNADKLSVSASNDSTLNASASNVGYGHSATNITPSINSSFRPDASSWGGDIGFVYEFRGRINKFKFDKWSEKEETSVDALRRDKNKYSLKVGVSLLDVGVLKFNSTPLARDFNATINGLNIKNLGVNNVQDFDTFISNNVNYKGVVGQKYSVAMPTALSAQVDWHFIRGFYLNAMAYVPFEMLNKKADYRVATANYFAVTPRWESRAAGVYVPFVYNNITKDISAGATVRVGPIFVGTSNLLTLIKKDNLLAADVHAGVKLPLAFGKATKASKFFKNITNKKEQTTVIEKEIIKDENGQVIEIKEVEKVIESKQTPHPAPQPIQIIINNYNGNGQSAKKETQVIELQDGKVINTSRDIESNENTSIENDNSEKTIAEQIEFLKMKIKQKQDLIDELNKEQEKINSGNSTEDSKKKIDALKAAFNSNNNIEFNQYDLNKTSFLSNAELLKELEVLNEKNTQLDGKIRLALNANARLLKNNNDNLKVEQLNFLAKDYMYLIENPILSYDMIRENKSFSTKENLNSQITTSNIDIENNKNLATKQDLNKLMTKNEYQVLKQELEDLKAELRLARNANLKDVVNNNNSKEIIRNNTEVKIIRDTIYLDKEVEKVVTKILRDTITNTIEKNNVITKTETKTEFVNTDKETILNMPPLVVLFDVGQHFIKPVYNERLNFYAKQIKKFPSLNIQLTGHTDKSGNADQNLILSQNRAKAVRNYLVSKGVNGDRINIEGLGANNPLEENKTATGKSQNRRVELIFIEK